MTARLRPLVPFGIIVIFVAALWLPFGLKTTGLMEEWLSYNSYERGTPTDRDEPVDFVTLTGQHRLRPLQDTTTALAHWLTPDSFLGLNLVHMVSIMLKGVALYLVLTQLVPRQRLFALTAALLLVVYPADEGIFTFRAVHIHGAVACYLLGVYFLLRAWERPRWPTLLLMCLMVVVSIFIYEVGYPLVVFTPLILFARRGTADFRKRFLRFGLAWYIAPLLTLLYTALTLASGPTYQTWVVQHSGINEGSIVVVWAQAIWNAYVQHFAGGWLDALGRLLSNPTFTLLAALLTAAALGVGWWSASADQPAGRRVHAGLIVVGLAVIVLGYALFLLTPYRELKWRVFLYSSVGGALCAASLAALIAGRSRLIYALVGGGLLFVAAVGAFHQHQYYVGLAETQQRLLRGVVTAVPQPDPQVPVVVVDETGLYRDNWTLGASYLLTTSLQYVYANYDVQFVLCAYDANGKFAVLPELREQCHFTADGVSVTQDGQPTATYPYTQIVVLRHTADATTLLPSIPAAYLPAGVTASGYAPQSLLVWDAAPPRRFATLFSIADGP